MDLPDMGPGSITYLPVRTAGARLFIGDAHACQGDGEVCGTAVEYPSTTTIRVDLIKGWTLEWPRLEREDFIMTIGSARPLEDATRIAYRELVLWMEAEYGYDRWDAYMMLSQCGRVRLGNFVDPKYTVGAGILKKYLAESKQGKRRWISGWQARKRSLPAAPGASAEQSRIISLPKARCRDLRAQCGRGRRRGGGAARHRREGNRARGRCLRRTGADRGSSTRRRNSAAWISSFATFPPWQSARMRHRGRPSSRPT